MRVIDSSVWVEILADTELASRLMELIPPDQSEIVIPSIVVLEVTKWIMREGNDEMRNRFLAFASQCTEVALDSQLALKATEAHRAYGLATADAIIYATALACDAELITCDAHFEGLDGVIFEKKKG